MKSITQEQGNQQKQENQAISRYQAVEFTLSQDQYIIIQHFLPKGYKLQQRKSTKREKGSGYKNIDAEMSRYSGGFDNTDENEGRSKRPRIKKIDRYLEQQIPRIVKRTNVEKLPADTELSFCSKILFQLKKHPSAEPFLDPVDSKKLGASHYFEIIKDPIDFQTIERNLKTGYYRKTSQFHADINKIWKNSYLFNEKTSKIFKMTIQMQKFYKKILNQISTKKTTEIKSKLKQDDLKIKDLYQQQEQLLPLLPQLLKNQQLKTSKNQQFSDKNKDNI